MPKKYINQVQVQMFGSKIRKAKIVVYQLTEDDYNNFFLPIDANRLRVFDIPYDEQWVNEIYMPKHLVLRDCLVKGVLPSEAQI